MATQSPNLSSHDVVLIDDTFMDLCDAALFGPDYIFVHKLQTRRQRFPRQLRMADLPHWFEPKRTLIPHETKVSCLDATDGPAWEREFLPVYVPPETAVLNARRVLVSAPATEDLELRRGVHATDTIPSHLAEAFKVGQSRFHVLQDFYLACAETTSDPVLTLQALVGKTEGYRVHRIWGSGNLKDIENLELPPSVKIDRDRFLKELLARRLEERFLWNWKLHAIVASRRDVANLEGHPQVFSGRHWEDELANPFAVQMLFRIRARQNEGFPVDAIHPWSGTGRYPERELPQHWRGSLAGLRGAVNDKDDVDSATKRRRRRKRMTFSDSMWRFPDGSESDLNFISFDRFGLTEGALTLLQGLHPDCEDVDLPLRLCEWLETPDAAAEAAMARYLRTWFGKLLRHQGLKIDTAAEAT
jgi:hypothetical protein